MINEPAQTPEPDTPGRPADLTVRLHLLTAGWTSHPGFVARRGGGRAPVTFPALVAVIDHPDGIVLFDTGYSPAVSAAMKRGINRIYGALLPVAITQQTTAKAQLAELGIPAERVTTIVLSHLHPDHLGGLSDFPGAAVVTSPRAVAAMRAARGLARLRRGWLPQLLPDDLEARIRNPIGLPPATDADLAPLSGARDLLGDGSLLVVPLTGHTMSDIGLLVRTAAGQVLLVGDAAWDLRAVTHGELPHPLVRISTHHWSTYRDTISRLTELSVRRPDIAILPSHDAPVIQALQRRLDDAGAGLVRVEGPARVAGAARVEGAAQVEGAGQSDGPQPSKTPEPSTEPGPTA